MSIERYSQNSCIIDGAVIKESAGSERVFRSLLAGVLSGGLEGMGMQTRLYIRTDDSKYVRILEECLGERSYDAEISEYKYNL